MKFTPQILGAVAVVAMAGAVAGATIGESPVLSKAHSDTMPTAPIVSSANRAMQSNQRLPDHYPLKTANGTVEVADLALRGRLRNRSNDAWWERRDNDAARMDAGYDFYETATPAEIEHERRLLAFYEGNAPEQPSDTPAPQRVTRAEAPMALAEPAEVAPAEPAPQVATQASIGNSKTVDVTATLARRD